jgi:sensor domain CHASE-containing protein/GGDEF domain-containing protein
MNTMSKIDTHIAKERTADAPSAEAAVRSAGAIVLRDFFMPLAIIGALLVLVLTLGVHYAVRAFDVGNEQRERVLASNGIEKRIEEVALMVVPQADWDDAITHLDHRFDPAWSRANIGSFLYEANGFDRAFVLDRNNQLLAGYRDGSMADPVAFAAVAPHAGDLIASVRAQEARRGPFPAGRQEKMISTPIQASALRLIDGGLAVTTATLVQPDFGSAHPLATRPIDEQFLRVFARRYLLSDLHVVTARQGAPADRNSIPIDDGKGHQLAFLAWKPLAPGYSMLRDLIVPVAAVSLLLIILASWQLWQIRRMAGTLIEREAFWREVASREIAVEILDRPAFIDQLAFELGCLGEISTTLAVLAIRVRSAEDRISPREHERFCQIAISRLRHVCRDDAIIARTGEDSLAILAVGADEAGAQALARRVFAAVATPFVVNGLAYDHHPLVGTVVVSDRSRDARAILASAQAAMKPIKV